MPDEVNYSVINLGNLAKPATALIEKVSNAVGGLYTPRHIRRLASANREAQLIEADAAREVAKIQAESEIEITDLHRRAADRWINEEARRQKNIEDITAQAAENLAPDARPNEMEDDWIVNFFDRCRIVSDTEMQNLWSRVLAGEANSPGTFSNRTVNFLSDLDKSEAESFRTLCNFSWYLNNLHVSLIFDEKEPIYNTYGLSFYELNQLESIGLIQYNSNGNSLSLSKFRYIRAYYFDKNLIIDVSKIENGDLRVGK